MSFRISLQGHTVDMEISPEYLKKLKIICKKEFKEDISDSEVLEIAQRVLGFLSLIYRPLPEGDEPPESPDINF